MRYSSIASACSPAKGLLALGLLSLAAVAIPGARAFGNERKFNDATGFAHVLKQEPRRIVTLAPSLAEIAGELLGASASDRIVGATEYTSQPKSLAERMAKTPSMSVGPFFKPNKERILALKPDLILATLDGNPRSLAEELRAHAPVVVVSGDSLKDVTDSFRLVGLAVGRVEAAYDMRSRFEAELQAIKKASEKCTKKKVLLQLGGGRRDPLIVVGAKNFIDDTLAFIAAENVYGTGSSTGGSTQRYPRPNIEDVVLRNPDAIVILGSGADLSAFESMRADWKSYARISAVRKNTVMILRSDELQKPTSGLIEGIRAMKKAIHGDSC